MRYVRALFSAAALSALTATMVWAQAPAAPAAGGGAEAPKATDVPKLDDIKPSDVGKADKGGKAGKAGKADKAGATKDAAAKDATGKVASGKKHRRALTKTGAELGGLLGLGLLLAGSGFGLRRRRR